MAQALLHISRLQGLLGGAAVAALTAAHAQADPAPGYSANLFGDLGGFRPAFVKMGGTLNLTATSEVFANPHGACSAAPITTG